MKTYQRKVSIGGKQYTLTASRRLIKTLYSISPKLVSLGMIENEEERKATMSEVSVSLISELDVIFYEMIKVAHPNIEKEKSDEILGKFEDEYEDVQNELLEFAYTVFQEGDQNKKKIVWE